MEIRLYCSIRSRGGGAIPLEAQRLGLEAHGHDLNPAAVMINKAMIEIPPRFAGMAPVNPEARSQQTAGEAMTGAAGLAEDVRYYGQWMKEKAFERIGHLYPKVKVPKEQGGGEATVIAWIWARTVKCPNPACGCEMPLASTFVLSKKNGNEAFVVPQFDYEKKMITYSVHHGKGNVPEPPKTSRGAKFKCIVCGESTTAEYIKQEALNGRMGAELLGVVAEGPNGRIYLSPDAEQRFAARVERPDNVPDERLPDDPRNIWCVGYGLDTYDKLFTPRQLTALATFSDLVKEAQVQAEADAVAAGMPNDHIALQEGGVGARAYSEAICVYLGLGVDRFSDINNSLCNWSNSRGQTVHMFGRQAIPMVWDFAENNIFNGAAGDYTVSLNSIIRSLSMFPAGVTGVAQQADAQGDCGLRNIMVSTDPPYYDNIGYADLSDFFYVWMRRTLKDTYPDLFRTMLVPKAEELVATPYRFDGSVEKARDFFEDGMLRSCQQICQYARDDVPVTIYYAYKQSDQDDDSSTASTGWETMLSAIIRAGFAITGTWPMRTEKEGRMISNGTNALASSVILVCRKRAPNAPVCTRRNLIAELKRELRPALKKLQSSNIAPVDLAQSAIGPGMGVFSKYSKVLEADGSEMTVRSALQIINQELDIYFNEQDGELDRNSRFCVELYMQNAFNDMKFGEADTLARAKNTSVAALASAGVVYAQKGIVHLLGRDEIPEEVNENEGMIWLLTQQLTHAMEKDGVLGCARIVAPMIGSNADQAKDLAYRLFTIADKRGWAQEAYAYNALVTAWPDIQSRAAEIQTETPVQQSFFD